MNKHFDNHFQKNIVTIHPGEYYASSEPNLISTVLGSCVSVAFFDKELRIGGLNHFLLAKASQFANSDITMAGRFGEYAIELLITDLIKMGSNRKSLTAKVFGGGHILETIGTEEPKIKVAADNVEFAFSYLKTEKIRVISSDTGGIYPRKIFYDPLTSKIWLKTLPKTHMQIDLIKRAEKRYASSIEKKKDTVGDIVWFS